MIARGQTKGFTIVELLVVIIVVAVLATLVALAYGNAQSQARDTQIRDAADKFADAIQLMQTRKGAFPSGGAGSTVAVNASTGCADGAGDFQAPGYSGRMCTIGDAAVAMGYLPAAFFTNLPINAEFGGSAANVFTVFQCGTSNYLFYYLEKPTNTDTAAYNTAYSACSAATQALLDSYKMRGVINLSKF